MFNAIRKLFSYAALRDLPIDDPETTRYRQKIIKNKRFLKKIYCEWYERILKKLDAKDCVLELGSGGGFMKDYLPTLITSEVFQVPGVALIADACALPLSDDSLDAIVMTDVLHHIPDVQSFFNEATRCIRLGGKLVMVEPWHTSWSRWVYKNLHSEPFEENAPWAFPSTGPLSSANGALPWIVFQRDKEIFEAHNSCWELTSIEPLMPFSYLLSGGVSMHGLMPAFFYDGVRFIEKTFFEKSFSMFAVIELKKNGISTV
jgi:SAM-dependent methyltransferase